MIDVTTYPEINDLILASDAAVLDYSSLRFDFALTGRPMLFLVPDLARRTPVGSAASSTRFEDSRPRAAGCTAPTRSSRRCATSTGCGAVRRRARRLPRAVQLPAGRALRGEGRGEVLRPGAVGVPRGTLRAAPDGGGAFREGQWRCRGNSPGTDRRPHGSWSRAARPLLSGRR